MIEISKESCPVLTVAIPTYERKEPLKLMLICVLNQLQNLQGITEKVEVIVVDNASSSYSIIDDIASLKEFSSVRFYRNDNNVGIDGNVKNCLHYARGNFVWLLSDDDLLEDYAIKKVISALQCSKQAGVGIVNYSVYDKNIINKLQNEVIKFDSRDDSSALSHLTFISSTIINRNIFVNLDNKKKMDKYLGSLYYHMAIAIELAAKSGFIFIEESLIKFRSDSSYLGGTLSVALAPYEIFKEINSFYANKLSCRKDTFLKNNVELFFKHQKKLGVLTINDLVSVWTVFGFSPYLMKLALIVLVPLWLINWFLKLKKNLGLFWS